MQRDFNYTPMDFNNIRRLIHGLAGISIDESKSDMVYSRISRRMRQLGLKSFSEYVKLVEAAGNVKETEQFVNCLTTNLTSFFREEHHFDELHAVMRAGRKPMRIWCSACSTGEEAYSVAITACEAYGSLNPPVEILATDIDTEVLKTAQAGIYPIDQLSKIPESQRKSYMMKGEGENEGYFKMRPEITRLIEFRQMNLISNRWTLDGKYDVIFCRNVLIYFDHEAQLDVIDRMAKSMSPGGLLFGGHSESFINANRQFRLKGKTIYQLS